MDAITPKQAKDTSGKLSPRMHPTMIAVVNEILAAEYESKGSVKVQQAFIMDEFLRREPDYTRERAYKEQLMDFEHFYRKAGWKVAYDKACYGENWYPPTYEFSKK